MKTAARKAWGYLRTYEPARLRAGWVAVVALAASQGFAVSADVDAKVQLALGVIVVVLPLLQGEVTRRGVYSPATVENVAGNAAEMAQLPGVPADRAAATAVDIGARAGKHMRPQE